MRRLKQAALALLLIVQALGGGAITLAHARDVASAPAAFEAAHDARCPVLHDALRCALCQYASTEVVVHRTVTTLPSRPTRVRVSPTQQVLVLSNDVYRTAPARAPPTLRS